MAIASLLFGLGAFATVGITAPLALILGGVVIVTSRDDIQSDRLAVGGIALALIALAAVVLHLAPGA